MSPSESVDIVLRAVPGYGWLPLALDPDGRERYRGEFRPDPAAALAAALANLRREAQR